MNEGPVIEYERHDVTGWFLAPKEDRKLKVFKDGHLEIEHNDKKKTAKISQQQFKELLKKIANLDFLNTPKPSVIVRIRGDATTEKLSVNYEGKSNNMSFFYGDFDRIYPEHIKFKGILSDLDKLIGPHEELSS